MLPFGKIISLKILSKCQKYEAILLLRCKGSLDINLKRKLQSRAQFDQIETSIQIRFKFWIETHQGLKRYLPVKSKISTRCIKSADACTRRLIDHIDRSESPDRARAIPSDILGVG